MAEKPRKEQRAKVPITRHPLFPAIVALWFAALFGLGSLAIRPGLIESLVLASHIDLVIPAAAPPLGLTARIFIALLLAVGGGMLGAMIARRIAAPKVEARPLRRSGAFMKDALRAQEAQDTDGVRRPISAHEEIGEGAIAAQDGGAVLAGRRRALAIEEDDDEFRMFETAPLPGGQQPVFDAPSNPDLAERAPDAHELDLGSFEPLPSAAVQPPVEPAFDPVPRQEFAPHLAAPTAAEPEGPFAKPPLAAMAAMPIDFSRPQEVALSAAGVEPLDFSRPSPNPSFAPFAAPSSEEAAVAAVPAPSAEPTGTDAVVAALDDLGLIELTERFAQTLRQRRERMAGKAAAIPADASPTDEPAPVPVEFNADGQLPDQVSASQSATTAASGPEAPVPLPAAMRPLDLDAYEDEDEDLSSLLPLRKIVPVAEDDPAQIEVDAPPVNAGAEDIEDAAIEADGYSSLLDLVKQPEHQSQFVRIEESEQEAAAIEPVVIFPGQAARQGLGAAPAPFAAPAAGFAPPAASFAPLAAGDSPAPSASPLRQFDAPGAAVPGQTVAQTATAPAQDPEETERALRAALATLQRMSGAA